MRKFSHLLFGLLVLPFLGIAQSTITAESIIASINANKPLALSNVKVTGDLNLTKLANMKPASDTKKWGDGKTFISTVTSPVSFTNCTFTGKVLGYFNPDNGKISTKKQELYLTNFDVAVNFDNCTFEDEVAFKYTEFNDKASFAGSTFNNIAVFKYTDFSKGPNFAGTTFRNLAEFKYVELPADFDFNKATFHNRADFKYAKLNKGGSFANARFRSDSDFKYASFGSNVNLKGAVFEGTSDFKYTELNNRKTTLSELLGK